jgi:NAD-dependent SIR2 family protein deacetylase
MSEPSAAMHGRLGDPGWAAPTIAKFCTKDARPGYKSRAAHEWLDQPDVLHAKVKLLADLVRRSTHCVAYTGAGISTASGISDYATKASGSLATQREQASPWDAEPTLTHHALVAMYHSGQLKHWVQQNHDGLPQKAGLPQCACNEIHGAWYDPSNPVVPMSGTLRSDLLEQLLEWEDKADLCLALGSSLCGMNADRMVTSVSERAKHGHGLGSVIVSLQQTQHDTISSLRIFERIDVVMSLLAKELKLSLSDCPAKYSVAKDHQYVALPYNKNGFLDHAAQLTLDLAPGRWVRIVDQPKWDEQRVGSVGQVVGITPDGHYRIAIGRSGQVRVLGLWWLSAAENGDVDRLPVVNIAEAYAQKYLQNESFHHAE